MGDFLDINNNEIDTNLLLHDILTVNTDYIESERAEVASIDPQYQSPVHNSAQTSVTSCFTTNSENSRTLNAANGGNTTTQASTSSNTPPSGQPHSETLAPSGGQSDSEPLLQPVAPQTDYNSGGFIIPSEVDLTIRIIRRDCQ